MKRDMERQMERTQEKLQTQGDKNIHTKLPKLVITMFQGTHLDWQRFWSQFETEIDESRKRTNSQVLVPEGAGDTQSGTIA